MAYLQVEGRKMSKSEGNFITIDDLLNTEKFGGRKWPGEVLRLAMLMTHYREPIDFSLKRLEEAESILQNWLAMADDEAIDEQVDPEFVTDLSDDLNISVALSNLSARHKSKIWRPKRQRRLSCQFETVGF